MRKLWARLGAYVFINEDEEKIIFGNDLDAACDAFEKVVKEGRYEIDGECYVPEPCVGDFNQDYGTNYEAGGDFLLETCI